MGVSDEMKKRLLLLIKEEIDNEFFNVHLSGNLSRTITIDNSNGGLTLTIPAQIYDITQYKKKGVIIYKGSGSYANEVDNTGGFSGKHKGYVDKAIDKAINRWMAEYNMQGRVQ